MNGLQKSRLREIESQLKDWSFPPQIVIETTSFCNMKCVHCNHKSLRRTKGSMSWELYKKIIDEIVAENPDTEIWPTFYGEAFILGERLFQWLRHASERGARNLVLNSNGSLLHHKDWIDQILKSGLKRLIFSLDGFSPEVFEKIRVGGKRNQIFQSIEKLLNRKKDLDLLYPMIQCQFSIMETNQHEFPQFKEYWETRGAEVKSRSILSWSNSGPVKAKHLEDQPDFRIACPWGNNTLAVHWNGDVVACAVDCEGRYIAGNLNVDSIHSIWNGKHYSELRHHHRAHSWDQIPEICKTCPDWQVVGANYHTKPAKPLNYSRPFWFKDKIHSTDAVLKQIEACKSGS